ncbi:PAS-domain containing protein [Pseudooceanicola aestuarii]|uniref:PAS-domain containing protein n=1 Tax=Pseudooceanicola aestuarii TaxID=2697319 RepID=UPI0013D692C9|nr:PAS-domain containing protein [Pseudooceanicola aestuarii]
MSGYNLHELILVLVASSILTVICVAGILIFGGRNFGGGTAPTRPVSERMVLFRFNGPRLVIVPEDWAGTLAHPTGADDWSRLADLLRPRFPDLPATPADVPEEEVIDLRARLPTDQARLCIDRDGDVVSLYFREAAPITPLDSHRMRLREISVMDSRAQLDNLPFPVWQTDAQGQVHWRNAEYQQLETVMHDRDQPPLMDGPEQTLPDPRRARARLYRTPLDPRGQQSGKTYDVIGTPGPQGWHYAAQDVTAQIRAEGTQQNFVQTLTKTFAQLDTGLAIFSRERELMLFNPALVDLTTLSADFMASRPTFTDVFDRLRDKQIMPEPKNYSSWREHLRSLASAAAKGTYEDRWSLPSGATYRVIGRPHPNGALAFLVDDITAEVTLTRQFRQQMTLSQSVLDAMADAIAVFAADGTMGYCNDAFLQLWDVPQPVDGPVITLRAMLDVWRDHCRTPEVLTELVSRMHSLTIRSDWSGTVVGDSGNEIRVRLIPLSGGAAMVTFTVAEQVLEDGSVHHLPEPVRAEHS